MYWLVCSTSWPSTATTAASRGRSIYRPLRLRVREPRSHLRSVTLVGGNHVRAVTPLRALRAIARASGSCPACALVSKTGQNIVSDNGQLCRMHYSLVSALLEDACDSQARLHRRFVTATRPPPASAASRRALQHPLPSRLPSQPPCPAAMHAHWPSALSEEKANSDEEWWQQPIVVIFKGIANCCYEIIPIAGHR